MEDTLIIKKNVNTLVSLTKQEKWEELSPSIKEIQKSIKKLFPPPKKEKEESVPGEKKTRLSKKKKEEQIDILTR